MSRRARAVATVVMLAFIALCAVTLWAGTAHSKVQWKTAGASVFGQPCDRFEVFGNHDNLLSKTPLGFAELGYTPARGYANLLGHLKNGTRVRIKDPISARSLTVVHVDVGTGGAKVNGHVRRIGVLWPALKRLLRGRASCSWTGTLKWRVLH